MDQPGARKGGCKILPTDSHPSILRSPYRYRTEAESRISSHRTFGYAGSWLWTSEKGPF
jgi:hypothetical protein